MIYVDGTFDDRPLAELGIPVIRQSAPDDPGVSEIEVVGAADEDVRACLAEQHVTFVDRPTPATPAAPASLPEPPVPPVRARRQYVTQAAIGLAAAGVVEAAIRLLH